MPYFPFLFFRNERFSESSRSLRLSPFSSRISSFSFIPLYTSLFICMNSSPPPPPLLVSHLEVQAFFDVTPLGRIMTRLSEDLNLIDFLLQVVFIQTINNVCHISSSSSSSSSVSSLSLSPRSPRFLFHVPPLFTFQALLLIAALAAIALGSWIIFLCILVIVPLILFDDFFFIFFHVLTFLDYLSLLIPSLCSAHLISSSSSWSHRSSFSTFSKTISAKETSKFNELKPTLAPLPFLIWRRLWMAWRVFVHMIDLIPSLYVLSFRPPSFPFFLLRPFLRPVTTKRTIVILMTTEWVRHQVGSK